MNRAELRALIFAFCIVIAGCQPGKQADRQKDSLTVSDTVSTSYREVTGVEADDEKSGIILDTDSLMDIAVKEALAYAGEHLQSDGYSHKLESFANDYTVRTTMNFGHLFETGRVHLHVRSVPEIGAVIDNVYLLENRTFKLIATDSIEHLNFTADSIGDVNGDKLKDHMIVTYASSGCCLRYEYKVYTYDSTSGKFGRNYYFINPDFFPDEKIVRGVGYGQPGEVGLYKLSWNDTTIKAIEYIYWDTENDKQFIRTHALTDHPSPKNGEVLKTVPEEYRHINGYQWFMKE